MTIVINREVIEIVGLVLGLYGVFRLLVIFVPFILGSLLDFFWWTKPKPLNTQQKEHPDDVLFNKLLNDPPWKEHHL